MRVNRCLLLLIAGFALGGPSASAEAQPVDLRFQLPAGTTYQVNSQESMQMQVQMQDPWGNVQQMGQGMESPTHHRVEVLEEKGSGDAGPGKVRYSFDPGQTMTMTQTFGGGGQGGGGFGGQGEFGGQGDFGGQGGPGGPGGPEGPGEFDGPQVQQQPLPFAGQTYEITRRPGSVSIEPSEGLSPDTRALLENLATFNEMTLLPGRPVSVGDTWKPDTSAIKNAVGVAPGSSLDMTARLRGMGQAAGRPAALVDLQLAWNVVNAQGMKMQGTQQGQASIDVATGLLLELELGGQLQVAAAPNAGFQGQPGAGGQPAPQMQGTSTLRSRRWVRNLVVPAAAGPPSGPFVTSVPETPGASETPGSAPPPTSETGPAGGATLTLTAPPFEGTFVGEKLSVTLLEGEQRSVRIERGELSSRGVLAGNREIDQSVDSEGNPQTMIRFQGEFEVDGNRYRFAAEQPDAQTLRFTTGKTTHTLKREKDDTPQNPFE